MPWILTPRKQYDVPCALDVLGTPTGHTASLFGRFFFLMTYQTQYVASHCTCFDPLSLYVLSICHDPPLFSRLNIHTSSPHHPVPNCGEPNCLQMLYRAKDWGENGTFLPSLYRLSRDPTLPVVRHSNLKSKPALPRKHNRHHTQANRRGSRRPRSRFPRPARPRPLPVVCIGVCGETVTFVGIFDFRSVCGWCFFAHILHLWFLLCVFGLFAF